MEENKAQFVKCKSCKMDIPKGARICPHCRAKQGVSGCLVAVIIVVVIGFVGIFGLTKMMADDPDAISKTIAPPSECITQEEFNKIEMGMTYQEVVDIIGSEGELLSEGDAGLGAEYVTHIIMWKGADRISNANVTFQGGKVVSKAQVGLK